MDTMSKSNICLLFFTLMLQMRLSKGTSWPEDATGFPNPFSDDPQQSTGLSDDPPDQLAGLVSVAPKQPAGHERGWVSDPDKFLSQEEGAQLNREINRVLSEAPCVCPSCQPVHPMGRYSIGVAIVGNITGRGSRRKKCRMFAQSLLYQWRNMKRCNDMWVVTVDVGSKTAVVATDPLVSKKVTPARITALTGILLRAFTRRTLITALLDIVQIIANSLQENGGETKSGFPKSSLGGIGGVIIGVVITGFIYWYFRKRRRPPHDVVV